MILIKPDHDRRIVIPGVPEPVRRPVDIDQAKTGFTVLRTLRIYCFDKDAVIEGHAEEDEVFIVVIAGSVELTIEATVTLSAPGGADGVACAAYLPPHAAYKLVPKTDADVAYARATPSSGRPAKIFFTEATLAAPGVTVLLEEMAYAERLRLRLVQFDGRDGDVAFAPVQESSEGLVHICQDVATVNGIQLGSSDTLAVTPSDSVTLQIAEGSSGLVLIVTAESQ